MDSTVIELEHQLLRDDNISFALIFGSHARNRTRPGSDLDLGVFFHNPPEGLELLHVINTLSNTAQKEIDLVVLNRASAFLRHQVVKEGIRLVVKDPVRYRQFREKTMIDYDVYRYLTGLPGHD